MRISHWLAPFIVAILTPSALLEGSEAFPDMKPRTWLEIPDTHMRKVAFQWPKSVRRYGNVRNVIGAWCSAAYDTKRKRLIAWGGGHSDYAGNEIYVFDVSKRKWERVNDPSTKLDRLRGETYPDGMPRSVHSYEYLVVIGK